MLEYRVTLRALRPWNWPFYEFTWSRLLAEPDTDRLFGPGLTPGRTAATPADAGLRGWRGG
jgi:hypothetical protein